MQGWIVTGVQGGPWGGEEDGSWIGAGIQWWAMVDAGTDCEQVDHRSETQVSACITDGGKVGCHKFPKFLVLP